MANPFDLGMVKFKITFIEAAGEHFVAIYGPQGDVLECVRFTTDPALPHNRSMVSHIILDTAKKYTHGILGLNTPPI